jgi:hypothetical protein
VKKTKPGKGKENRKYFTHSINLYVGPQFRCAGGLLAEIVLEFLDSLMFALTKVPSSRNNQKDCITLFGNTFQQLDIPFLLKKRQPN